MKDLLPSKPKSSPRTRVGLTRVWVAGLWMLAYCLLFTTGCARHLTGTYTDENKIVSIEFKNGKAYLASMLGDTSELDYRVKNKDLVLQAPQGNMVLHIQDDGALSGFGAGTTLRKVK